MLNFRNALTCAIENLEQSVHSSVLEAVVDVFDYRGKIIKQSKYVDKKIKRKILKYFDSISFGYGKKIIKDHLIGSLTDAVNYINRNLSRINIYEIEKLLYDFVYISHLTYDYYLYMRIFRRFSSRSNNPEPAHYAFVYCGDLHATNIRLF